MNGVASTSRQQQQQPARQQQQQQGQREEYVVDNMEGVALTGSASLPKYRSTGRDLILGTIFKTAWVTALGGGMECGSIWERKSRISLIYAAFMLAVLNVVDKFIRLSLADPWLHPLNQDGYPLLYMRSNAARLPRALMLDFVFRCSGGRRAGGGSKGAGRGCAGLLEVLNEDSVLERLDLSGCDVGVDGAAALGACLKSNKGLRVLVLANTRLGPQGVDSICKGVSRNATLRELDLSRSGCDDKGAGHLAQALQSNNTLEKLNVGNNRITDTGAKLLADALQVGGEDAGAATPKHGLRCSP
ncbi:hypothetical protein GPECTOR_113g298 [Gonium pectorale]|uniref:Uncharacterized protein n=1 Tax=Gonium pectorale TaxID=33097 RepID=A0A150FZ40_GONPE|nr:hypothetical protein GPECTOR_113g298 [Gonium pectorale]|eukprot:KXZ42886.1 hypothetical protein GPECTOR_113g298 [Gonium pectorale]